MVKPRNPLITVSVKDDPKEYHRQRRIINKEKIKEYNSSPGRKQKCVERIRNKKWILIQMLGSKCKNCGLKATEENSCVFDFHHIEEKSFGLAPFTRSMRSLEQEAKKCIILCANCHRMEHKEEY